MGISQVQDHNPTSGSNGLEDSIIANNRNGTCGKLLKECVKFMLWSKLVLRLYLCVFIWILIVIIPNIMNGNMNTIIACIMKPKQTQRIHMTISVTLMLIVIQNFAVVLPQHTMIMDFQKEMSTSVVTMMLILGTIISIGKHITASDVYLNQLFNLLESHLVLLLHA